MLTKRVLSKSVKSIRFDSGSEIARVNRNYAIPDSQGQALVVFSIIKFPPALLPHLYNVLNIMHKCVCVCVFVCLFVCFIMETLQAEASLQGIQVNHKLLPK